MPALGAWLVTGRDLVIEAMRDADRFTVDDPRFTTAAVLGPSMLSLDGAEHERLRAPFGPAFRPGALRARVERTLIAEVHACLDAFDPGEGELRTGLAGPIAVTSIASLLGLDGVNATDVLDWYRSISAAITDLSVTGITGGSHHHAVAEIERRVVATLASPDAGSLIADLALADQPLDTAQLTSSIAVLMFGAIETAEGMTANALWHLLSTPGAWAELVADPVLFANAIEESLRLEPAAAVVDRYTTAPVELGDVALPERELVTLSLLAANHDPDLFADPDGFDLHRANARQHVTFVQGPHACIGLHLARMETAAALTALIDRMPSLTLDRTRSDPPAGLIFRKPERLWARW